MNASSSRRTGWLIAGTVILCVAGALVGYVGTRGDAPPTPARSESAAGYPVGPGPVYSIVLPHDEPIVPMGPHREVFQTSCTVCHSTRLVFNQPALTEKQWTAVVDKMAKVYGAPLTAEQQREIVAYLAHLHEPPGTQAGPLDKARPGYAKR